MEFVKLALFLTALLCQRRTSECRRLISLGNKDQTRVAKPYETRQPTNPSVTATQSVDHPADFLQGSEYNLTEIAVIPLKQANYSTRRTSGIELLTMSHIQNRSDEKLENLNYETLWRNGSRTLTIVEAKLGAVMEEATRRDGRDLEDENFELSDMGHKTSIPFNFPAQRTKEFIHHRQKRRIFGKDSRMLLSGIQARKFPFGATVLISTGCTGTLISPQHVLTAAHCVHDGTKYLAREPNLRVGFLRKNGRNLKWANVQRINLPSGWVRIGNIHYDYAVLELTRPKKRPYMDIGVLTSQNKPFIHFSSFPCDKRRNTMWHAHCKARVVCGLIVSRCDAYKGSSGAGVYVDEGNSKVLIGILSGSGNFSKANSIHHRNGATRITYAIAKQICIWTRKKQGCYPYRIEKRRHSPRG